MLAVLTSYFLSSSQQPCEVYGSPEKLRNFPKVTELVNDNGNSYHLLYVEKASITFLFLTCFISFSTHHQPLKDYFCTANEESGN